MPRNRVSDSLLRIETTEVPMRGADGSTQNLFSYMNPEQRIPANHPLRFMLAVVNDILEGMSAEKEVYFQIRHGPPHAPSRLKSGLHGGRYSSRARISSAYCSMRQFFGFCPGPGSARHTASGATSSSSPRTAPARPDRGSVRLRTMRWSAVILIRPRWSAQRR